MKKDKWQEAADCLRLLAHRHRLRMLDLLIQKKELTVGELAEACSILPNVASEHLTLLKTKGFLSSYKVQNKVFYKIEEKALESILECIRKRFG